MKHTGTSSITLRRTLMVVLRACLEYDLNTVSSVYKLKRLLKRKCPGVNKDCYVLQVLVSSKNSCSKLLSINENSSANCYKFCIREFAISGVWA